MAFDVGEISGEPAIIVWQARDDAGDRYWTWRIVTTALLSQGSTRHPTPQGAFSEAMANLNHHVDEHNLRLRKPG
jgi:hypothetical protein